MLWPLIGYVLGKALAVRASTGRAAACSGDGRSAVWKASLAVVVSLAPAVSAVMTLVLPTIRKRLEMYQGAVMSL